MRGMVLVVGVVAVWRGRRGLGGCFWRLVGGGESGSEAVDGEEGGEERALSLSLSVLGLDASWAWIFDEALSAAARWGRGFAMMTGVRNVWRGGRMLVF